ncbi:hypothetical protein DP067_00100 [Mycoplasmopsis anatis]|uniref:leucine-rich repeat protein n=1 Tax=Mycoplasmopsis anatis TaxID=171279 RepID=UPI0009FC80BC|nr:hypothetical protein DP067_00100 [Mycoplasmopsis anatis]
MPDKVSSIESYAFSACSKLKLISFSKSSRFIGHSSFSGCSSLTLFILPESLNWIDNQAFENCSNSAIVNIT